MPTYSVYNLATKLATEVDRCSAPSGNRNGKAWYEGGRWVDAITDGLPSIQDQIAIIFPQGHAGDRRMNQQAPVQGRKWSEGDFSAPVVADLLNILLYAAMGSASTAMVPSSSGPTLLLNAEPLSSPKSLVLNNQPSDGGAILRFIINGIQGPGTISVCGIDAFGNGASELISLASAGAVWSRTSWSSIAASGIAISGLSAGTVSLCGIRNYTHTFTHSSVAPTLSIERQGVPTTGEASANLNHMHVGMVLKSLTFETNAEAVDGLFTLSAEFEGDPSGASAKTTLNGTSSLKIWPSWTLRVRRDNGTTWDVVQNMSLAITPANANYRAAAGVQGPQGTFYGGVEYTGSIEILLTNEAEYQKWRNASELQLHALWDTPWKLAGSTNYSLSASIPCYFENVQVQDSDGKYILGGDIRVSRNDNFPFSFLTVDGMPGAAISGTASANL
jgi:hypothetical protein